jgi:phosphate-selective porin OprO/OprP
VTARVFALIVCSALASAVHAQESPEPTVEERLTALEKANGEALRVFWKDGLRFESADKRYKLKLGGRMHYDVAFFDPDDDTKAAVESGSTRIEDGSEIRRGRIEVGGEVGDRVDWASSVDFGGGSTNLRNIYVGLRGLPFGSSVRAGQFKEPYGLEQITSSNNILFLERSLMNTFVPAFNAGVMLFGAPAKERLTWSAGLFRTGTDSGEVSRGDGEWAATARVTGLPFYDEEGDDYVHLGLSASHRSPTDDEVTFSAKPEANLAPAYVAASALPAETVDLVGAEAAWVRGPLTISGEYTTAMIEAPSSGAAEPDFSGYYVQASWFLTGESRPYRKASGCFDAIKPRENAFGKDHGLGAWEVAARISAIDLVDETIDEGELSDVTLGVNWYLNPNTRFLVDYVLADLEPSASAPDGETSILAFRVQFAY